MDGGEWGAVPVLSWLLCACAHALCFGVRLRFTTSLHLLFFFFFNLYPTPTTPWPIHLLDRFCCHTQTRHHCPPDRPSTPSPSRTSRRGPACIHRLHSFSPPAIDCSASRPHHIPNTKQLARLWLVASHGVVREHRLQYHLPHLQPPVHPARRRRGRRHRRRHQRLPRPARLLHRKGTLISAVAAPRPQGSACPCGDAHLQRRLALRRRQPRNLGQCRLVGRAVVAMG